MNRPPFTWVAVLAVTLSVSAESHSQARGPSAKQMREEGQKVQSMLEIRRQEWEIEWGQEARTRDRDEMRRDTALSLSRLAEMEAFLRRLTGRFRIEGKIERKMQLSINTGLTGPNSWILTGRVPIEAEVTGVGDCTAVGEGAGVHCIISATWPVFDRTDRPPFCPSGSRHPLCQLLAPDFTAGEMLDTMRPAVLVLGLDTDPPQLRGMLVTADTLTNEWVGKLESNDARLLQTQVCTTLRCYGGMEIHAEPDGEVVTITLHQRLLWAVTVTLRLHRDPGVQLENALKPMQAHF